MGWIASEAICSIMQAATHAYIDRGSILNVDFCLDGNLPANAALSVPLTPAVPLTWFGYMVATAKTRHQGTPHMVSPYEVLGVSIRSSPQEIDRVYVDLVTDPERKRKLQEQSDQETKGGEDGLHDYDALTDAHRIVKDDLLRCQYHIHHDAPDWYGIPRNCWLEYAVARLEAARARLRGMEWSNMDSVEWMLSGGGDGIEGAWSWAEDGEVASFSRSSDNTNQENHKGHEDHEDHDESRPENLHGELPENFYADLYDDDDNHHDGHHGNDYQPTWEDREFMLLDGETARPPRQPPNRENPDGEFELIGWQAKSPNRGQKPSSPTRLWLASKAFLNARKIQAVRSWNWSASRVQALWTWTVDSASACRSWTAETADNCRSWAADAADTCRNLTVDTAGAYRSFVVDTVTKFRYWMTDTAGKSGCWVIDKFSTCRSWTLYAASICWRLMVDTASKTWNWTASQISSIWHSATIGTMWYSLVAGWLWVVVQLIVIWDRAVSMSYAAWSWIRDGVLTDALTLGRATFAAILQYLRLLLIGVPISAVLVALPLPFIVALTLILTTAGYFLPALPFLWPHFMRLAGWVCKALLRAVRYIVPSVPDAFKRCASIVKDALSYSAKSAGRFLEAVDRSLIGRATASSLWTFEWLCGVREGSPAPASAEFAEDAAGVVETSEGESGEPMEKEEGQKQKSAPLDGADSQPAPPAPGPASKQSDARSELNPHAVPGSRA